MLHLYLPVSQQFARFTCLLIFSDRFWT